MRRFKAQIFGSRVNSYYTMADALEWHNTRMRPTCVCVFQHARVLACSHTARLFGNTPVGSHSTHRKRCQGAESLSTCSNKYKHKKSIYKRVNHSPPARLLYASLDSLVVLLYHNLLYTVPNLTDGKSDMVRRLYSRSFDAHACVLISATNKSRRHLSPPRWVSRPANASLLVL